MTRVLGIIYLSAGLVLFSAIIMRLDMAEVAAQVAAVGWGFAVVVGIFLVSFTVDSVSWMLTLSRLPVNWTWITRTWRVRLAGEAFNYVLPAAGFGGEPLKVLILKRHYDVGYREATTSLVLARTLNMIGLIGFLIIGFVMMLAIEGLPSFANTMAAVGLGVLSLGTVLMVLAPRWRMTSALGQWLGRWAFGARLERGLAIVVDLEERISGFYDAHRGRFVSALLLGFMNWVIGVGEIYVTLAFIGVPVTWTEAWVIEAVAQMVRTATFFIPASIGAQEGAFVVIAGAITGAPTTGLSVALVRRLREAIWVAAGLAMTSAYAITRRDIRNSAIDQD